METKEEIRELKTRKLYNAHSEEGERRFGEERWGKANFGWSSGHDFICTKVYGDEVNSTQIFESRYEGDKIVHEEGNY